jgi:hypothetical protein
MKWKTGRTEERRIPSRKTWFLESGAVKKMKAWARAETTCGSDQRYLGTQSQEHKQLTINSSIKIQQDLYNHEGYHPTFLF